MDFFSRHLLSLMVLLPAAGAAAVLAAPWRGAMKPTAIGVAAVNLILAALALLIFDWRRPGPYDYAAQGGVIQLAERSGRIPLIHCQYIMGIDGLSLPPVLLACLIFVLAIAATDAGLGKPLFARLLLLQTALLGTLLSLDFLQFWIFFSMTAIVARLLASGDLLSGVREVLRQLLPHIGLGSLLIFLVMPFANLLPGGGDLVAASAPGVPAHSSAVQCVLFILLMIAMLDRLALPLGIGRGTILAQPSLNTIKPLVALTGGYGIFRIAYPLFPQAAIALWPVIVLVGLALMLFSAISSLSKPGLARIAARLATFQIGIILLGAAMLTPSSINGAWFTVCATAATNAMLCTLIALLAASARNTPATPPQSAAAPMPAATLFAAIGLLSLAGAPVLSGFVGQFLVVIGIFQAAQVDSVLLGSNASAGVIFLVGGIACFGMLLMAIATVWKLQKMLAGDRSADRTPAADITPRDAAVLAPLAILIVLMGMLPTPLFFALTGTTASAMFDAFKARVISVQRPAVASREVSLTMICPARPPAAPPKK